MRKREHDEEKGTDTHDRGPNVPPFIHSTTMAKSIDPSGPAPEDEVVGDAIIECIFRSIGGPLVQDKAKKAVDSGMRSLQWGRPWLALAQFLPPRSRGCTVTSSLAG